MWETKPQICYCIICSVRKDLIMTKTRKLGSLVFCVLVVLLIPLLFSGCGETPLIPTSDYYLSDYSVTTEVYDNGEIKVREAFTVNSTSSYILHGVTRYVPLDLTAYYDRDGKVVKKNYRVEITDAQVISGNYEDIFESGDNFVFQLGDASRYMSYGEQYPYVIEYTMVMPDDRFSDLDIFYYNVLPFDWDAHIERAEFSVNFHFDTSMQELYDKTMVYVGEQGTTSPLNDVVFTDTSISGSVDYLSAFNGVTVYTEFEEGVLGTTTSMYIIISGVGLAVIIVIAILLYWYYHKKRIVRHLVPTVEFKVPEGLTPAECGLILDGKVDNRDLVSMIIYWASRGHLQIIEKDKNITLKKLKDLDDTAKSYEKTIFNCIFSSGEDVALDNIKGIGEKLLVAKAQLKKDIKHLNYEPKTKTARNVLRIFSALIPAIATGIMLWMTATAWSIIFAIVEFIVIYAVINLYTYACDKEFYNSKGLTIFYKILSYAVIVICGVLVMLKYEFYVDSCFMVIVSHLVSMLLMYLSGNVLSRTEISNERLGKIIGLKNFILVTEKDKMEMLVKDNPQSFYDVLPYAYVLNVTDVYCEKFEDIDLTPPSWYSSDSLSLDTFTTLYFITALNSSMSRTYNTLLNATNSVKLNNLASTIGKIGGSGMGGGRTGGGFGGGGFGGGGGRGW